jgi:hypothetical protein
VNFQSLIPNANKEKSNRLQYIGRKSLSNPARKRHIRAKPVKARNKDSLISTKHILTDTDKDELGLLSYIPFPKKNWRKLISTPKPITSLLRQQPRITNYYSKKYDIVKNEEHLNQLSPTGDGNQMILNPSNKSAQDVLVGNHSVRKATLPNYNYWWQPNHPLPTSHDSSHPLQQYLSPEALSIVTSTCQAPRTMTVLHSEKSHDMHITTAQLRNLITHN